MWVQDDDNNDDDDDDDDEDIGDGDDDEDIGDENDDEGCWWRVEQLHRIYSRGAAASFALAHSYLGHHHHRLSYLGQIINIFKIISEIPEIISGSSSSYLIWVRSLSSYLGHHHHRLSYLGQIIITIIIIILLSGSDHHHLFWVRSFSSYLGQISNQHPHDHDHIDLSILASAHLKRETTQNVLVMECVKFLTLAYFQTMLLFWC